MKSVMCGYLLVGCLLLPASEVKLTAGIADLGNGDRALKLSLLNNTSLPITVISGVRADHSYPTANFTFVLDRRHHSFKVNCKDCGPGMIGGTLGLYTIVLSPKGSVDLPSIKLLSLTYVDDIGQRPVCGAHNQRGSLRITLNGSATNASSATEKYWSGNASTSINLICKSP